MTIKQCEERNKAIIDSLKDWIKGESSIDGYLELAIICEYFKIRIPKAAYSFISSENPNDVKASGNMQTFKTLFNLMDKIKMTVERDKSINNQKLFIDETDEIISYDDIKKHFENGMEEWEREEYNNDFEEYLACCMYWNGGTLAPYTEE